jgi:hypothetical protein
MRDELVGNGRGYVPEMRPWTIAGGPDHDYDETVREECRSWLTEPRLIERFRLVDPHAAPVYEHMIRVLGLVWECPDDGTVNVVGYRCAGCGSSREVAALAARCRDGGVIRSRAPSPDN